MHCDSAVTRTCSSPDCTAASVCGGLLSFEKRRGEELLALNDDSAVDSADASEQASISEAR